MTLERNYRSSGAVLAAANAAIALAPERFAKNLWTDRPHGALPLLVTVADDADQARYVATRVLANREAGARLKARRCCFALPTTAPRLNSSSPAATCRSSSTGA